MRPSKTSVDLKLSLKQKQKKWGKLEKAIEKITDALSYPIDEEIKQTVVAFNAYGFPTYASCIGHLDHSLAHPWIDIHSDKDTALLQEKANELFRKARELEKQGKEKESLKVLHQADIIDKKAHTPIMKLSQKLVEILSSFYENRGVLYDFQLTVHQFGDITRVESMGGFLQIIRPAPEREKRLKEYQKEMKDFGEFLKEKYFQNKI